MDVTLVEQRYHTIVDRFSEHNLVSDLTRFLSSEMAECLVSGKAGLQIMAGKNRTGSCMFIYTNRGQYTEPPRYNWETS
jgi:hypothetical protein